ncbi:uncharacterized protein HD556DRAFT_478795 [Suillus plorans]|uniref:Uncharacterized protein n=1 Tax=Suillus plorans TaxID=116603 RepID=A0A9P7DW89_9AGAM|nr:uncharacterized protein HD556DRAFT_478795 [Suillus plorans]KAG1804769.1 hypothetical protein HD556DRAFT_478795 [Suillus plorans]
MSLLIAIAWIMAITEVVINVVADIWFRIWTLGCSDWSYNPRSGQLPCRSQKNRHEHGRGCCKSFPKSWASPHASVCLRSSFSSTSVSPALTRSCKLGASCVYYMVDAYLLKLRAEGQHLYLLLLLLLLLNILKVTRVPPT